jgi:glycosyltransferase involved in cell wall biosynthesis
MSWSAYGSVEYRGVNYGQKNIELLKYLDLPRRAGNVFEIALGGVDAPAQPLRDSGWIISEALAATLTVEAYLDYIGHSRGEFSVAKEAYVKTRCGWFSDRTVAYLASGKPAIVQDTGFRDVLPCGKGLFAFQTTDDVANAVEEIGKDYERHCRAARQMAQEYFDSDKVLRAMLQTCDAPVTR